ncbi:apolipoprotein N-acyltransferase [bacterium]|nr:MAG: apolipoprotein N-acyltransferase [bacterium]
MLRQINSHIAPCLPAGRYRTMPTGRQVSHIVKVSFPCLLSAVLLILSFPKFNLEFVAWFGFVPLFLALENKSKSKAFLLFYLTGVIFWFGTIYWLIHVTLPGLIVLVLYLALYFAIFGLLVFSIGYRLSAIGLLFIPALWVVLEYLRGHLLSGFGWALLGYSQYLNLPVIQIADITGVWGVSFLVMISNVIIYTLITRRSSGRAKVKSSWFAISCIIIVLLYGFYKINQTPKAESQSSLTISVIQGNIPQEMKWDNRSSSLIIERYFNLTAKAIKDGPDLIIWPEAALPVVLEEEPVYFDKVLNFTRKISTPLLLGVVTYRDNLYYNSALLISKEGSFIRRYDKIHLVPFGEYIPLRKVFDFLETIAPIGDITAGKEYTLFEVSRAGRRPLAVFSVLICFEDLFPELSRRFVSRGAEFLVNITNDAWFGDTSSPYQHLAASVFRAVENRVFLVRSANTGVSGFISPQGKIISLVEDGQGKNTFIPGALTQQIDGFNRASSFYTHYGDLFILVCFLFILSVIIFIFKKKR